MKRIFEQILRILVLAVIYGAIYVLLEKLWRGHSHWTMFLLGGLCGLGIGGLNNYLPWDMGLLWQCFAGASLVTVLEFVTGVIVNIYLGWGVWDYSNVPLNFMGQICVPFMLVWILLSGVCIVVDDWLRYILFDEEYPHYRFV